MGSTHEPANSPSGSVGGAACQMCGTPVPDPAVTWMVENTPRGTAWACPTCARAHLRAIESKLDQEYW